MKIDYFVGFIAGVLTLAAVVNLDLPRWAGVLLSAGCAAIGLLVAAILEGLFESGE